jgi:GT2 family glycosyltransferase
MSEAVLALPVISVITPTYNRWHSLRRLLAALERQTYPHARFEVVIVDDGSTDGTPQQLANLRSSFAVKVVEQAHQGPAEARNRGVAHAVGSLILFLDDDVEPRPDLIDAHVMRHANAPDVVVIGPLSPPGNWPRSVWVRWEEEKLDVQYRAMLSGLYACTPRQFYTGNASLARERFLAAAGFDVTFKRAEDIDLGFRLRDQGAQFVFDPQAEVLHYAARSFDAWCQTPYEYGRYDVIMDRYKGRENLQAIKREFQRRHPLNRLLPRVCLNRGPLLRMVVGALRLVVRTTDRIGARGLASPALSAIFNLLYWQGVADESRVVMASA